jgi:ComEC/Rec2-related protein
MTVVVLAGFIVERPAHALNSLAAAALLILLWDTNQLFATGFQLSFGVVLALLLLGGPLQRRALRLVQPDPFLPRSLMSVWQRTAVAGAEAGAAFVAVSLAAWLGSLPLGLWYFHMLPPVAVLANFVAVPLAFVVMAAGMMAFAAAPFSAWLVAVCNSANWLVTKLILAAMAFFAALPGGHFYVGFRKMNAPPVEITVFDFGDGGGAHLRCDGRDWLIDCGRERDFRWTLQPYLRTRGVNRLDGLVLTHGDGAHIGAARGVVEEYKPALVVDSPLKDRSPNRRALAAELHARARGRALAWSGDTLTLADGVRLRVLHPPADAVRRTADDKALVLLLEARGCRVLFMSDSGFITEKWLLEHDAVPRCDILVKGLHGRDFSGTAEFLSHAQPAALVTACDSYKPGGGLDPEWCDDVRALGIELLRQDETGAVTIRVWPGKWEASAFLGGQTFTSRAR